MERVTLDTPNKRLFCFAVLYVCEGIPQGLTETFLPAHFAKRGVSDGLIGDFGFWDSQPWAWKWLWAPFVDILLSKRRWLLATQLLMGLTLLLLLCFPEPQQAFQSLTAAIFLHNVFSATQDVAIDAIAVGSLPMQEGPAADGAMFAAQELGNMLGGSGALWVSEAAGYFSGLAFVLGLLAMIFLGFTCRLEVGEAPGEVGGVAEYFAALRTALWGPGCGRFWKAVAFAAFPSGALLLRGPHCKSKMVAEGFSEGDVAWVEMLGKVATMATMLAGGFLSSSTGLFGLRLGPRRLVAAAYLGSSLVSLAAALLLFSSPRLSMGTWLLLKVLFHFLHGFHIGPQMSLFRSVCGEGVAATLFTAFCALCNNADSWGKAISGSRIERSSFQEVLLWDAAIVLLPVAILLLGKVGHVPVHRD